MEEVVAGKVAEAEDHVLEEGHSSQVGHALVDEDVEKRLLALFHYYINVIGRPNRVLHDFYDVRVSRHFRE